MALSIKLTIAVIIATTALLIGYDIWAATNAVPNSLDTISGRIKIWAYATPLIPWVWCGLAGHFFGPFETGQFMPPWASMSVLVFLTWSIIWLGATMRSRGFVIPPWTICVPAFMAGSILWAQG